MRRLLEELDTLAPDERGRVFERQVVPWILRTSPVYRDQLKDVWAWDAYRQRHTWGPDIGIDLIAEDQLGRVWAVQAKAFASDLDVTWTDISTFVGAAAARTEVHCLVLITTARSVGRRAQEQLHGCGKSAIIIDRERLLELGLPDDVSLADLTKPRIAADRLVPRPHQGDAIAAAVEGFAKNERGQVIHPCGTGKTLTALWIKEALGSRRTLVFCPSLSLIDQTLRAWEAHKSAPFAAVVVCSDQTIGGSDDEDAGAAALELAVPPTTQAEPLREAMAAHADAVVVFATYQSSGVVAAAMHGTAFRFDLLIADEAHRTVGTPGGDFQRPLDDVQIGADRRLFLTATPRIVRTRSEPDAEGDAVEVVSMDDATIYGPRFQQFSFREAIERDLLSDYRVVVFGVTPGEVAQLIADRAYVTHDGTDVADADELATHVGLARTMREFGMRRTISFHHRVKSAGIFATRFLSVANWLPAEQRPDAPVWTAMLSGEDSIHKRRQVLRRLREGVDDECGLISNARCLAEGIDVPAIDGIVFVDPKSSDIDIVQAVGRALRKSKEKSTISTIVLPIVIPDDPAEATMALEGSRYAHIWRVIDALRSHDQVLGEALDAIRRGTVTHAGYGTSLPAKIVFRLPRHISSTFSDALSLKILERVTSSWEVGYAHLEAFRKEHGHARVPQGAKALDGTYRLGQWVSIQRATATTMPPERRERLDALGFVWDAIAFGWEEGYAHLAAYKNKHGDALVPQGAKALGGTYRLGQWIGVQRRKATTISSEQRQRLDALGFVWDVLSAQWEEGYAHLAAFTNKHGHARVPFRAKSLDGTYGLGQWVSNQRKTATTISAEQRQRLDALGFVWDVFSAQWDEGYAHLAAYKKEHGDALVPSGAKSLDGTYRLGQWVSNQRATATTMSPARRERLDALGFVWDVLSAQWEEGYAHLAAYKSKYGHARVPQGAKALDGTYTLGQWVSIQRATATTMPPERRQRLDALGFVWDALSAKWEEGYAHLAAFYKEHGHAQVPHKAKALGGTHRLGLWVMVQRRTAKSMSPARRERLDALGFVWDVRNSRKS
jgi:superfamily II DNA or RNA helicase